MINLEEVNKLRIEALETTCLKRQKELSINPDLGISIAIFISLLESYFQKKNGGRSMFIDSKNFDVVLKIEDYVILQNTKSLEAYLFSFKEMKLFSFSDKNKLFELYRRSIYSQHMKNLLRNYIEFYKEVESFIVDELIIEKINRKGVL